MFKLPNAGDLHKLSLAGILGFYLAVAAGLCLTKVPVCDEGFYADPAVNLVKNGSMGSPVLESAGTFLKEIERYTYWEMPLHIVTQAGWYEIFGASLFSMRALSTVAGMLALLCWYVVVLKISNRSSLALLAMFLAAIDTTFLGLAATGRTDMLSVAFGAGAQACYLLLRTRNFKLALFVSHSLVAASGMTHPIGGLTSLAAVVFLQLYFDRRRLTVPDVLPVAAPYLIGGLGWAVYILKSPDAFLAQFSGNSAERLWPWKSPLLALKLEITQRFIGGYRAGASSWTPLANLRLLILVTYVAGLVALVTRTELRRSRPVRVVFAYSAFTFFILLFFEGAKQSWYLIHVIWIFTVALAIALQWHWEKYPRWRPLLAVAVAGFALIELGYPALLIARNRYKNSYSTAIAALAGRLTGPRSVMGSAELGFGLGFDNVLDDHHFGYYSRKAPAYIVLDPNYRGFLDRFRQERPEIYRHFESLTATRYQQIYSNGYYDILARTDGSILAKGTANQFTQGHVPLPGPGASRIAE